MAEKGAQLRRHIFYRTGCQARAGCHSGTSAPGTLGIDERATGRRRIKKLLKRAERLEFLNFWVVESLSFLARFGPLGPKPESLVVTSAFAAVNFVEQLLGHARRACVVRFARCFVQKCELFFGFFGFRARANFLISEASRVGAFLIFGQYFRV